VENLYFAESIMTDYYISSDGTITYLGQIEL